MWTMLALLLCGFLAGKGEVENGGFEKGSVQAMLRWSPIWPRTFSPEPEFRFVETDSRTGKRCAEIRTRYAGGYTSFTQEIAVPKKARAVHFSGWIRMVEQGSNAASNASFLLLIEDKERADFAMQHSARVTEVGGWTHVAFDMIVPDDPGRSLLRCGVTGPARVRFDDVELTWTTGKKLDLATTSLASVDAHYKIWPNGKEPWLQLSIPIPFRGQVPLAFSLRTEPEGRVLATKLVEQRENRLLRVYVAPSTDSEPVRVHARTWVLFDNRLGGDGKRVKLAKPSAVPDDIATHLEPAPGVEADDERIVAIAEKFSRKDLATVVGDLLGFLDSNIDGGSGVQGALDVLDRGTAACTGHANLGTALLIAAGVPTRILACVLVGAEQQEHYIAQAWTPKVGWHRIETTTGRFPLAPSKHAVLRVIYPDTPRNGAMAPIYYEGADGSKVRPGYGALESETSFQTAEHVKPFLLTAQELEALRAHTTESFEALLESRGEGGSYRFAPATADDDVGDGSRRVLQALDALLE